MMSSKSQPAAASGSWNPLRLTATPLPVPVLLMAKLIAVSLLLANYAWLLPGFAGPVAGRTFQVVFVVSAVAVVFNRAVVLSCLLLGGSLFPGLFSFWATLWFFVIPAATLVFLRWPGKPLEVIYDGDCGFCDWTRRWLARIDFDGIFHWLPFQSGHGGAHGISPERASHRLQLVTVTGSVLEGFHAVRRMLVYIPLAWLILFALAAMAPSGLRWSVAGTAVFFFSPLANFPGVALYDWIARNRHRIFPSFCPVAPPRELEKMKKQ
jgi:predicted DCC family thiol-disulfide oxidoreductase YuxK